jgi:orotate phosphoribosyltransferase
MVTSDIETARMGARLVGRWWMSCLVLVAHDDLAARVGAACRLTGQFVLRSGRVAEEYFDKYQLEADPVLLDEVGERMAALVPEGTEVLAGLEMGGIAVVTALGRHVGLPCAFVRKVAKPYGTARLAEGSDIAGRRVLVVEDVVTSGGQIAISAGQLREMGAKIEHALCVIDRQEGGAEALTADGIALGALFTRKDLDQAADGIVPLGCRRSGRDRPILVIPQRWVELWLASLRYP